MSVIATALLSGASLGLSIAAPIGPTSLLCVQRTLSGGLPTGLATGLGVATVHLTYGTLVAGWGADLATAWSNVAVLSLVSGTVLLALAVRVLRSVTVLRQEGERQEGERRRTLAASYGSAIGLALANPVTPVLFLAAMPALLAHGAAPLPVLVAGVFLGSLAWWVTLNTAVSLFRGCVTSHVLQRMNKAAGLLLAALALSLLAKGLVGSLDGPPYRGIGGAVVVAGSDRP
ncbi:LysE family transporter [Methylobacterium sp. J-078]|uniref:LysE family translocator n=1 Tax=Methylobacterium sp. J-078 TaxID=2836657 RepID=UPI001FBB985D|nr:LysE family transporter [Methylobacterium sp. J-078]MCJ2047546.1 LysE family transporter [Methylobacterium sp. J-078]